MVINNSKTITMSQETFDFSKVDAATETSFLRPGFYKAFVSNADYIVPEDKKPDGSAKTPYLEVTFSSEAGILKQKFFVTPKTMNQLQYIHKALFGKNTDKEFKDAAQVGAYFVKALTGKKVDFILLVRGQEQPDGKVYGSTGYSGFILPHDAEVPMGAFEVGSPNWNQNVTKAKTTAPVGDNIMAPIDGAPSTNSPVEDKLPWED